MGTITGEADVAAWLWAGDVAYSFGGNNAFWLGLGWDVTSGDGGGNRDEVHNFYDYYYSRHSYRGHMDYFKDPFKEPSLGLHDFIFRTGIKPVKSLVIQADLHYFATEQPFASKADGGDAHQLGYELDLTGNWKIRPGLSSRIGVDIFWPSEDWKGTASDTATYSYFEITAEF